MALHGLDSKTGTGSQSCIESLKNDLRSFQGGLRELLSKTEGLQVPSWRFPERLAVSVDTEELLKDVSYCSKDNCSTHVMLLELVVDRYEPITIHTVNGIILWGNARWAVVCYA